MPCGGASVRVLCAARVGTRVPFELDFTLCQVKDETLVHVLKLRIGVEIWCVVYFREGVLAVGGHRQRGGSE